MKRLIVFLSILVVLFITLTGCGGGTVASWTTSGTLVNNFDDDGWELSVGRANGHIRRDVTLSQEQLDMLHVRSRHSGGEITLTLTQGDTEITSLLGEQELEFIVTTGLEPGTVRIQLDFDSATDVDVEISWRAGFFFFH